MAHPPTTQPRLGMASRSPMRTLIGFVLALLAWSAQPPSASAWTRAQVRGAQAHVDVIDASTAVIALRLRVHISGGWLSELDLPGLPSDIEFDAEKPVTLTADSGEKYVADMVLRRGVWRLAFASKHKAPWRGDYTLTLLYRQSLSGDHVGDRGAVRATWTMPPWRMGIEDARIWISGPSSLSPAASHETGEATSQRVERLRGRTLITHQRTHLPRDTEWTVGFEVPNDAAPHVSATDATPSHAKRPTKDRLTTLAQRSAGDWLPWIVCLLAWFKAHSSRRLADTHRAIVRPLIAGRSRLVRSVTAIALALGAHVLWLEQPWIAATLLAWIVLLALDRGFAMPTAHALRWTPIGAAGASSRLRARAAAVFAPHRWIDITTAIGALAFAGVLLALWTLGLRMPTQGPALILLAVLITPLWMTATQHHLPWQGRRIALALQDWCARHRSALEQHGTTAADALLCIDDAGRDRDARLPLSRAEVPGLRNMDLSLVTDARSLRRGVAMLVQTDLGTTADKALCSLPRSVRRVHHDAAVHVVPTQHILTALAALHAQAKLGPASSVTDRAAA